MRIELRHFSFEPPAGFEDWTNYSFKDREDVRVLTVATGAPPEGATELGSLMADRKRDLEHGMGDALVIETEREGRVGGWPARLLTFTVADRGGRFREQWAVAFDGPESYLQISYAAPVDDPESGQRFEHIIRSVSSPETGARGFVRRWSGRFSLDVPDDLVPPRTYQFASGDDATHLVLSAFDLDDEEQVRNEPTLDQEVAEDEGLGAVDNRAVTALDAGPERGTAVSYTLDSETPDGAIRDWCRRVVLPRGDRVRIHLYGRTPVANRPALERAMTAWIDTFRATH